MNTNELVGLGLGLAAAWLLARSIGRGSVGVLVGVVVGVCAARGATVEAGLIGSAGGWNGARFYASGGQTVDVGWFGSANWPCEWGDVVNIRAWASPNTLGGNVGVGRICELINGTWSARGGQPCAGAASVTNAVWWVGVTNTSGTREMYWCVRPDGTVSTPFVLAPGEGRGWYETNSSAYDYTLGRKIGSGSMWDMDQYEVVEGGAQKVGTVTLPYAATNYASAVTSTLPTAGSVTNRIGQTGGLAAYIPTASTGYSGAATGNDVRDAAEAQKNAALQGMSEIVSELEQQGVLDREQAAADRTALTNRMRMEGDKLTNALSRLENQSQRDREWGTNAHPSGAYGNTNIGSFQTWLNSDWSGQSNTWKGAVDLGKAGLQPSYNDQAAPEFSFSFLAKSYKLSLSWDAVVSKYPLLARLAAVVNQALVWAMALAFSVWVYREATQHVNDVIAAQSLNMPMVLPSATASAFLPAHAVLVSVGTAVTFGGIGVLLAWFASDPGGARSTFATGPGIASFLSEYPVVSWCWSVATKFIPVEAGFVYLNLMLVAKVWLYAVVWAVRLVLIKLRVFGCVAFLVWSLSAEGAECSNLTSSNVTVTTGAFGFVVSPGQTAVVPVTGSTWVWSGSSSQEVELTWESVVQVGRSNGMVWPVLDHRKPVSAFVAYGFSGGLAMFGGFALLQVVRRLLRPIAQD